MITHKERMQKAIRGEMADRLAFAPRMDLWHSANSMTKNMPKKHQRKSADQICRDEGWALHKVVPDYVNEPDPDAQLHRALGIFALREQVFRTHFSSRVEIRVQKEKGGRTNIEYHTPKGVVRTATVYTDGMKKAGISAPWVAEHAIKRREDYAILASLFENLELIPAYEEFKKLQREIGEDGLLFASFAGSGSPIHHIQKSFLDPTEFYFHYKDYQKEMRYLAESMEPYYNKALEIFATSPAEVIVWGANYDEMITYPPYFTKDIQPWIRKASEHLAKYGKVICSHCDGENQGLMDLIRDSGLSVAEAVCPAPMTKVTIDDYYRHWSEKLTIFGGIPATLLLKESTTDDEFEAFMDHLFKAVAPGRRMILGIADTVPPQAVFERLVRIGELLEMRGWLPLEGGAFRPVEAATAGATEKRAAAELAADEQLSQVQNDVLSGDQVVVRGHILALLERGVKADAILQQGLLSAMEVISDRFRNGEVFIPEVLLSARVMNEAVLVLEPYLTSGQAGAKGRVMIGTVKGDMHDIGKNLVITMLRGVGYDVKDLGIDVSATKFVEMVKEYKPDILGLSALLTTTMSQMKVVIDELSKAGLREGLKVIVGGAPVNEKFAHDIGADSYGHDAGAGVKLVEKLIAEKKK